METIIDIDKALFTVINYDWQNTAFDKIMPIMRTTETHAPLYLFLIVFVLVNGGKNRWWWLLFAIVVVSLSDVISSRLIKENIQRLRPCNDPTLNPPARFLLNYRPQSSSFTSSHAFNHFAQAAFFAITLKKYFKKWSSLFYLWAACIGYAQIYVGVHFPLDVVTGGTFGFLFGYLCARLFNKNYELS
ncbi:MAG: phosphatase PAP2 family protein [Ferruginibacter sp.]|nr:phosphatase PAP2 family protein [Ferruginibacter sp.]